MFTTFLSKFSIFDMYERISPNFEASPWIFPLELNLISLCGVTRDLIESFGEKISLILIFSQIEPKISYNSHTKC